MLWFTSRVIQSFSSRVSVPPSLRRFRNMYAFEPARLSSAGTSHDTNLYAIWFILFCCCGRLSPPRFLCCHSPMHVSGFTPCIPACLLKLHRRFFFLPGSHPVFLHIPGSGYGPRSVSYTHLYSSVKASKLISRSDAFCNWNILSHS